MLEFTKFKAPVKEKENWDGWGSICQIPVKLWLEMQNQIALWLLEFSLRLHNVRNYISVTSGYISIPETSLMVWYGGCQFSPATRKVKLGHSDAEVLSPRVRTLGFSLPAPWQRHRCPWEGHKNAVARSWSSNTLATWCKELTLWKRPWCWEWLKAKGEERAEGWNGSM